MNRTIDITLETINAQIDIDGEVDTNNVVEVSIESSNSEAQYSGDGNSLTVSLCASDSMDWEQIEGKPDFSDVATSGAYGDLTGKPKINNITLDGNKSAADIGLATAAQGAKADAAYQKPVGGIPGSDMSAAVQSALEKAETALQEHQSLEGYATEAWVEGKGYLTEHQDISGKQDTLVSGENIKTINGESILGSGNIVIEGGGGGGYAYVEGHTVIFTTSKASVEGHTLILQ